MNDKYIKILKKYKYNSYSLELTIEDLGKAFSCSRVTEDTIQEAAILLTSYRWSHNNDLNSIITELRKIFDKYDFKLKKINDLDYFGTDFGPFYPFS